MLPEPRLARLHARWLDVQNGRDERDEGRSAAGAGRRNAGADAARAADVPGRDGARRGGGRGRRARDSQPQRLPLLRRRRRAPTRWPTSSASSPRSWARSTRFAVNAGSSALICGLIGAGVGPGDEVIVPAYTWNATRERCDRGARDPGARRGRRVAHARPRGRGAQDRPGDAGDPARPHARRPGRHGRADRARLRARARADRGRVPGGRRLVSREAARDVRRRGRVQPPVQQDHHHGRGRRDDHRPPGPARPRDRRARLRRVGATRSRAAAVRGMELPGLGDPGGGRARAAAAARRAARADAREARRPSPSASRRCRG